MNATKQLPLEAVRGVAALVVVAWHLVLCYFPSLSGFGPSPSPILGTPAYVLINGQAAVTVFFVLSGYVLTRKFFLTGDVGYLWRGALRRLPRLMPLVAAGTLLAWVALPWGRAGYEAAGQASGSTFLQTFGFARLAYPDAAFGGGAAIYEALVGIYLPGNPVFNGALWTMKFELAGSLLAYALAAAHVWPPLRAPLASAVLIAAALAGSYALSPNLAGFVVGLAFAVHARRRPQVASPWTAAAGLSVALVLLGFTESAGLYAILAPAPAAAVHLAGAALLLQTALTLPPPSARLAGGMARLGRLSFPVYAVHLPLTLAVGSRVFMAASNAGAPSSAPALAAIASVVSSLAIAYPLAAADAWWTARLSRGSRPRPASPSP